jgi:hypothetical protein
MPVRPGESFCISGHTVWVHPQCLVQRARQYDQNPESVPPLARDLAQAWLRGQATRSPPSSKPDLRVIK